MNNSNRTSASQENKDESNQGNTKTLWVGDLDKIKDEVVDENYILYCMFYEFAEDIIKVKLCKEKNSQKNSYAFIEFTNLEIAKYCFDQLNGKWIPGKIHKFKLNWAKYNLSDNTTSSDKNVDVELDDKGTYSLYVGSLPKNTTKEEIEILFSTLYSSICFVKMIKNTQKNQNKIYCFIHFFNYDECIRALTEMDGYLFKGHKIKVSKSNGIKINNTETSNHYAARKNYDSQTSNLKGVNMNSYAPTSYNASGYNASAYNANDYNSRSYNASGYTASAYNAGGYNAGGYTASGYNASGYTPSSYNVNNSNIVNNTIVKNNMTDEEENNNNDPNKNLYFYYNNVNNEITNPYDLSFYDPINSNVNSFPAYGTNANSPNSNLSYNTNNYTNHMSQLNYYTSPIAQINNYNAEVNPPSSYTGDINLMNNNYADNRGHVHTYTGEHGNVSTYNPDMNQVSTYNMCSTNKNECVNANLKKNDITKQGKDRENDSSGHDTKRVSSDKDGTDNVGTSGPSDPPHTSHASAGKKAIKENNADITEKSLMNYNNPNQLELSYFNISCANREYSNFNHGSEQGGAKNERGNHVADVKNCGGGLCGSSGKAYHCHVDTGNENRVNSSNRNHSNANSATNNTTMYNNDGTDDNRMQNIEAIDNNLSVGNYGSIEGNCGN
ncbi:RNA binding function, putative [Plasmodium ovale wallikeri]|uniref:RNA binding function, putative n=2 Tax=Plasmodium ovale TaxID=36330 RepID=A0A1A8Z1C6_PLAOA|nr:RNA binding function, putative [Plasmodium ovale wallikeri]SBT38344.1 RNA binding function, putative [Plasmodium ovale wallikeri]SBT77632.1 RNA-binding protein, putative [Plasmodium ovale]